MDAKLKERFENKLEECFPLGSIRNCIGWHQLSEDERNELIEAVHSIYHLDRGSDWVDVNGYKEMPEGKWLVWVETPKHGEQMFLASINTQCPIVGSLFAWDMPKVIAYSALPNPPIKEK